MKNQIIAFVIVSVVLALGVCVPQIIANLLFH